MITSVLQVLGGCCSNVYSLEQIVQCVLHDMINYLIIRHTREAGHLVTLLQFSVITIYALFLNKFNFKRKVTII